MNPAIFSLARCQAATRLLLGAALAIASLCAFAQAKPDDTRGLILGEPAKSLLEPALWIAPPVTGEGAPQAAHGVAVAAGHNRLNGGSYAISTFVRREIAFILVHRFESGQWVSKPGLGVATRRGSVQSMDFDGERLIFGLRPADSAARSSVFILHLDPFQERWTIEDEVAAPIAGNQSWGTSVAISGHFAAVGMPSPSPGAVRPLGLNSGGGGWSMGPALDPGAQAAAFGTSVALRRARLAVGDPGASLRGRVRIWQQEGGVWQFQEQLIRPGSALNFARYGQSVALHGESDAGTGLIAHRLLVGAPGDSTDSGPAGMGRAYLYSRVAGGSSFVLRDGISAEQPAANDNFGEAVSMDGGYALIGAPGRSVGGQAERGAVYAFRQSFQGVEGNLSMLTDPQGSAQHMLGLAISVTDSGSGPRWLLGSPMAAANGNVGQGVVLAGNGTPTTFPASMLRLELGQGLHDAQFGNVLRSEGGSLLVSAPTQAIGSQIRRGAAYYFPDPVNQPLVRQQILAPDGVAGDLFGLSMARRGGVLAIGSPLRSEGGFHESGAIYIYRLGGDGQWAFTAKLVHEHPRAGGRFGIRMALAEPDLLVVSTETHGRVELYEHIGTDIWAYNGGVWRLGSWGAPDVHTDGRSVVIAEPRYSINGDEESQGAVSVLNLENRQFAGLSLQLIGSQVGQWLGQSVALDGERLVVMSPGTGSSVDKGLVQVYRRANPTAPPNWLPEASFPVEPMNRPQNFIGLSSVALRGDTLAISSGTHVGAQEQRGAVFLYRQQGPGQWQHQQTIEAQALGSNQTAPAIGLSALAWIGETLAVGTSQQHSTFERQGRVHLLREASSLLFANGFE